MLRIVYFVCIFSILLDMSTTYVALNFYPHIFTEGNDYISCIYQGCGVDFFVSFFLIFRILITLLVKNLAAIDEVKLFLLTLWAMPGLLCGTLNFVKLFSIG